MSPPLALTTTRDRDASSRDVEQRARILEAAENLFRDIGLYKTTVADIARALRMSPANVYRFYASKAEIQEAVAVHILKDVESRVRAIAAGETTAAQKLRAIVKSIQAVNAERLARGGKLHEMVDVALSERWPLVVAHVLRIRGVYTDVIAQGVARGEFAVSDPAQAAALFQVACVAYVHPRLVGECVDMNLPPVDAMIDMMIRAWRAPERPQAARD